METKKYQKNKKKYHCSFCDYTTLIKSNFTKHLATAKHRKLTKSIEKYQDLSKNFVCVVCSKTYKSRVGLWKHKKKHRDISSNIPSDMVLVSKKDLTELLENKTVTNYNTQNNISINFFLNEFCQNAMNLTEFIENIKISLTDIMATNEEGYSKGISNIFKKGLENISKKNRPIHCTDKKRGTLYIKDNDIWEKDTGKKALNAICKLRTKQLIALSKWEEKHPEWYNDPNQVEMRCQLVNNLTGGCQDKEIMKNQKLVLKEIAQSVPIKDVMGSNGKLLND